MEYRWNNLATGDALAVELEGAQERIVALEAEVDTAQKATIKAAMDRIREVSDLQDRIRSLEAEVEANRKGMIADGVERLRLEVEVERLGQQCEFLGNERNQARAAQTALEAENRRLRDLGIRCLDALESCHDWDGRVELPAVEALRELRDPGLRAHVGGILKRW